jgi:hypothetical protein
VHPAIFVLTTFIEIESGFKKITKMIYGAPIGTIMSRQAPGTAA